MAQPLSNRQQQILERLPLLPDQVLRGLNRGIEKESLRVDPQGGLALTPHQPALGSALTHPHITTDFSEAQLELITGVHNSIDGCLTELKDIHRFVYEHIGNELLWASSMPCKLPSDDAIPVGHYGSSNAGRTKTIYRIGLGHRYGRRMQTISGIHYNFSLPNSAWSQLGRRFPQLENPTDAYFGLVRNFRRYSWLLIYLYGASPAVCGTFLSDRPHGLQSLKPGTLYLPHATSLRMGPLGYQSDVQSRFQVSYNSLESYAGSLYQALTEPYGPYSAIGIRQGDEYLQLNDTVLQIENEFYSTIRPKRPTLPGERPLHALGDRGVEYVEIRLVDLDPFSPIGIDAEQIRLMDVFLLHCLLTDSPMDYPDELPRLGANQRAVVSSGRDPSLMLTRPDGEPISLKAWSEEILTSMEPIAERMDAIQGGDAYRQELRSAAARVTTPARTPSARVLEQLHEHDDSFFAFAMAQSSEHAKAFRAQPLPSKVRTRFDDLARVSLRDQQDLESRDTLPFETYRQRYLDKQRLLSRAVHP